MKSVTILRNPNFASWYFAGGTIGLFLGWLLCFLLVHHRVIAEYHAGTFAEALNACREDQADMCGDYFLQLYGRYCVAYVPTSFLLGLISVFVVTRKK